MPWRVVELGPDLCPSIYNQLLEFTARSAISTGIASTIA